jgi:hypothetical protein
VPNHESTKYESAKNHHWSGEDAILPFVLSFFVFSGKRIMFGLWAGKGT